MGTIKSIFLLYDWRDFIEIAVFSLAIYRLSLWLRADKSTRLLAGLYGYVGAIVGAHLLELPTLSTMLMLSIPAAITLCIVLHQHTLQKNLVAYKAPTPRIITPSSWLENLVQLLLTTLHQKKEINCIIEYTDCIEPFLTAPYMLNVPLHQKLLELILSSGSFDETKLIWLTHTGILRTYNAITRIDIPNTDSAENWQNVGSVLTSKFDVLYIHGNKETQLFDLMLYQSQFSKLTAHQLYMLVQKQIRYVSNKNDEGKSYDLAPKKSSVSSRAT